MNEVGAQERLRRHAGRLDLTSLLAALRQLGYAWHELRFASHASTVAQSCLIHDVELRAEPRLAIITLNLGLLSAQSPLPSYLFKELDAGSLDAATFFRFIGFFDHAVLASYVLALHPELDAKLFADCERARLQEVQLLNLRSSATLHWLFQQVFPELGVRVEVATKKRHLRTRPARLGTAVLGGDDTFGRDAVVVRAGRRVTLFSDDGSAASGAPWPVEARTRLGALVERLVRGAELELEVLLVVREPRRWATLAGGTHLGYEQLRSGGAARRPIKLYDTCDEVNR